MNRNNYGKKAVVIGSGLGGLSAAISLASDGFDVTLVEKNDKVGGKLNEMQKQGFTFDLGPSILTMPHIFRDLFKRAGKNFDDYVQIQSVEPHWRNFFEDGCVFDLSSDQLVMQQQLAKLDDNAYQQYQQFLDYSKKLTLACEQGYFSKGLDTLAEVINHHGLLYSLLQFDMFRSMDQGVRRFIKHPKLVEVMDYFIKYVGSSPYDAPAVLNVLPFIQHAYGLWYVKGGMYELALGLEKLVLELGCKVLLETEVTQIKQDNSIAKCVYLNDGKSIQADVIVSNMEVIPAQKRLLGKSDQQIKSLNRFVPSCSGLVMHLGVDRQYNQLAHHNFFYSEQAKQHFRAVFHDNKLSEDPTIYLVAPTKTDATQAPEGCEVIKVLPHIANIDLENPISPEEYLAFREKVINKLERMGLDNLSQHIVCEETWTPYDIESRYYSNQGSIYGVVSDRLKNLGFKLPQQDKQIKNLYYVGGSVNPGAGMPMVTLSGMLVADKINKENFCS